MDTAHTFLFTDVEGSSRLWDRFPEAMMAALRTHDSILRQVVESNRGHVFKTAGDALYCRFPDPEGAIAAAVEGQRALMAASWAATGPLRVRVSITTGTADRRDGDYFGPPLNRAARMLAAGHGGQILLDAESRTAQIPHGTAVRELGLVKLRGIDRSEPISQVDVDGLDTTFPALTATGRGATNLPVNSGPFVGREEDLHALIALARRDDGGLITLTGPGGTGKTALAIALARELADEVDGAYLVEMAGLTDGGRIVPAIAEVLGLREGAGFDLRSALFAYLDDAVILLVLDNLEQISGAPAVIGELAAACPRARLIATSRQALRVRGEHEFTVEPLQGERAAALFVERARAANPRFSLGLGDEAVIAAICARLDGLPLAIELAAARTRVLSLDQLWKRLERRLPLLTGGARDLPERQQTLEATIGWSYDLLEERERIVLRALSIFSGGWEIELAERLLDGEFGSLDVLDAVSSLAEQSLIQSDRMEDVPAFRMLGTIREFAGERLKEHGEFGTFAQLHANVFASISEESTAGLAGNNQAAWLAKLSHHADNLRAALDWLLAQADTRAGVAMTISLVRFWRMRGALSEGRGWLAKAIAVAAHRDSEALARLCDEAGIFAQDLGELREATELHRRAMAIWEQLGDVRGLAESGSNLATIALFEGKEAEAERLFKASIERFRTIGERRGAAAALNGLGMVAFWQGEPAAARALYEEGLAEWRALGDVHSTAITLGNIGHAFLTERAFDRAEAVSRESLDLFESLGDPGGVATSTLNIALVALARGELMRADALFRAAAAAGDDVGDAQTEIEASIGLGLVALAADAPERAVTILATADARRASLGLSLSESLQSELNDGMDRARATLTVDAFERAWTAGRRAVV